MYRFFLLSGRVQYPATFQLTTDLSGLHIRPDQSIRLIQSCVRIGEFLLKSLSARNLSQQLRVVAGIAGFPGFGKELAKLRFRAGRIVVIPKTVELWKLRAHGRLLLDGGLRIPCAARGKRNN